MNCKYCKADCVHRGEDREKDCRGHIRMTNADRIRAMSDEELAGLVGKICLCSHIQYVDRKFCESRAVCGTDCIVDWLKQPVKDGEDE